jgi:hypothetical protein
MNIVDFFLDPETRYTLSGIAGGFFLSLAFFGNRSIPSWSLFIRKICKRKSDGINYEWFLKSSNAVFYPLIGVMVLYFSIQ